MSDSQRPEPDPAEPRRVEPASDADARTTEAGAEGTRPEPRADAGADVQADADAWADACAEDLAAEKARRRVQYGMPPGSAADELRKLVDVVADKLSGLSGASGLPGRAASGSPLFNMAAQGAAQQMIQQAVQQAKAAVEPVIERNPDVFDHLAAAGSELLAAYRSAVETQERRWTRGAGGEDEGPGPGEHIDLD